MRLFFSHDFSFNIWNTAIDPAREQMVLELRNPHDDDTFFAAFDLKKGLCYWDDLSLQAGWWSGITALSEGLLIVHTYEDSQNPTYKSYSVIDVLSKKICWQTDEYVLLDIYQHTLIGYQEQEEKRQYRQWDAQGQLLGSLAYEQAMEMLDDSAQKENNLPRFPLHYADRQSHFATVEQFVALYLNAKPVRGCDYLEYKDIIIISYYLYADKTLANHLLVVDQEGHIHLNEKIDHGLQGIGRDTFLVVDDKLIFIKNKSQLTSYVL